MEAERLALGRVLKHKDKLLAINPLGKKEFDQPLRAALTNLITKNSHSPNPGSARGLRYLRDRISVPRDMSLQSARVLRIALEKTAALDSNEQSEKISLDNRLDQNPLIFI